MSSNTVTTEYAVTGMTCEHCVSAVSQELRALAGVADVRIDLVAGGRSTVEVDSDVALDLAAVREAVDEAGYELADADVGADRSA